MLDSILRQVLPWQSVSPALPLLSKELIVSQWAAYSLSCPGKLSLEYPWLYVLEPTCRHYPASVCRPLLFLASRCVLGLRNCLQNIRVVLPFSRRSLFLVTSPRVSVSNQEPDTYGYDRTSHPNNETLFRTMARSDHLLVRVICAYRSRCGL